MSSGTDCAISGVMTVLIDHNITANMSTVLQPNLLAVLPPMIWRTKSKDIDTILKAQTQEWCRISILYLAGEVSESESRQYPSLPVQIPFELVGHENDGNGHDHSVCGVDEVCGGTESHDARRARQHPKFRHCSRYPDCSDCESDRDWRQSHRTNSLSVYYVSSRLKRTSRSCSRFVDTKRDRTQIQAQEKQERLYRSPDTDLTSVLLQHGKCFVINVRWRAKAKNKQNYRNCTGAFVLHRWFIALMLANTFKEHFDDRKGLFNTKTGGSCT